MFHKAQIKTAYRRTFLDDSRQLTGSGKLVLEDLYKYVRMFRSGVVDKDELLYLAGARDVVCHIMKCLKITDGEMSRHLREEVNDNGE